VIVDSFMKYIFSLILFFIVFSCTPSPRYTPDKTKAIIKKTGKKTKKYDRSKKVLKGISSYYGPKFHGKLTANGEVFDMYGLTAAHKTLPLNTIVRVTNLSNDKSLILRINDRGPYVGDRILDCSYGAAKKLDFVQSGTTDVRIEVIEWGDNKYMKRD
tara:strand:- start:460 stop:933 length:474 start_codon:yes stop_codon:yes gene_type:complete